MDDAIHLDPEFLARQEAGREALRIFDCYGEDCGCAVIRGKMIAFVFAHAAIRGRDETLIAVHQLASAGREANATSKAKLTVLIGGKSESISSIRPDHQRTAHPIETPPAA